MWTDPSAALAPISKNYSQDIGKLVAVYGVCLFGFVIWMGLAIS